MQQSGCQAGLLKTRAFRVQMRCSLQEKGLKASRACAVRIATLRATSDVITGCVWAVLSSLRPLCQRQNGFGLLMVQACSSMSDPLCRSQRLGQHKGRACGQADPASASAPRIGGLALS